MSKTRGVTRQCLVSEWDRFGKGASTSPVSSVVPLEQGTPVLREPPQADKYHARPSTKNKCGTSLAVNDVDLESRLRYREKSKLLNL